MSSDQNSQNPSLGEFLRQERESRGITIEQVASATKISVRLLHLIESDQYSELPAKPFIRGFVNSYCRFIGIDAKEVLIRFGQFLEEKSHDRPVRDQGHSGYAFEKRDGEQSRTVLGISMAAFVVLGGLAFVILKPSLHRHHNSHADKLREANASPSPDSSSPEPSSSPSPGVSESPSPASTPSPSSAPSAAPAPTPSQSVSREIPLLLRPLKEEPKPQATKEEAEQVEEKADPLNSGINLKNAEIKYKIVLKTEVDTWLRYQVDDRPKMKFILRAGKVLVLRAQKEIRFQASEPQGISYRINGGASRAFEGDANAAMRGNDLTLFVPKEIAEKIQDPFPGERPLKGAFMPVGRGAGPTPSRSH